MTTQTIIYPITARECHLVTAEVYGADPIVPIIPAVYRDETLEELLARVTAEDSTVEFARCTPAPQALARWSIDTIARRDVPANIPYLVIDIADIPSDTATIRKLFTGEICGIGNETNRFE